MNIRISVARQTVRRTIALIFVSGAMSACGKDGGCVTCPTYFGVYDLVEANGYPLPILYRESTSDRVEVIGGYLELFPNDTYTEVITVRQTRMTGEVTVGNTSDDGSFSILGTSVRFQTGTRTFTGKLSGDTISFTSNKNQWFSPSLEALPVKYAKR